MHNEILVQGVLDLCFMENGGWVLVDYKTDRCPAEALLDLYSEQILWYKKALEEITEVPVREVWLYSLRNSKAVKVE